MQTLYFFIPENILRDYVYHYGIASVSTEIINGFTDENVRAEENKLVSSKAILEIVRGCDGIGTMLLLVSAILAFPTSTKNKIIGIVSGVLFLYIVNTARIIIIYFIVAYQYDWFLVTHTYLAPTFIIALCALFFAFWIAKSNKIVLNKSSP
ncbi:MAG: exosortase family protein XrtM [Pseudomonadota bacterium]